MTKEFFHKGVEIGQLGWYNTVKNKKLIMESFEDITMKDAFKSKLLPMASLAAGLAGCCLRWALYAVAVDEKNLLPMLHPLELALWALTAAAAAVIVLRVWKLEGSNRYVDNFRPSVLGMAGAFAMAAGILATVLTAEVSFEGPMSLLWRVAGYLSVPGLVLAGVCRLRGKRPLFLCHFVVCVFFALHMVSRYQMWSGNPQLQDYFYCLSSSLLLTLFAYYQAAFDVGAGRRRMQLAIGLLAGVCCMTALPYTQSRLLYLAGGVWTLTNLCTQNPVPRRKKEDAPEQSKE